MDQSPAMFVHSLAKALLHRSGRVPAHASDGPLPKFSSQPQWFGDVWTHVLQENCTLFCDHRIQTTPPPCTVGRALRWQCGAVLTVYGPSTNQVGVYKFTLSKHLDLGI